MTPGFPKTRAECVDGMRPCPWRTCRHHTGRLHGLTCTLDAADRGGMSTAAIAEVLGISRQAVEKIIEKATAKFPKRLKVIFE